MRICQHWKKWNFKSIVNFAHITEFLTLGKALNIYIEYLMLYLSTQYVK